MNRPKLQQILFTTRMHSSRTPTAHSSSRHGGGSPHPPGQIPLNFPLGCGPGPDPPQLPPLLWAWRPPRPGPPPGPGTPSQEQAPPAPGTLPGTRDAPSVNRITDACENITLPQLRCGR